MKIMFGLWPLLFISAFATNLERDLHNQIHEYSLALNPLGKNEILNLSKIRVRTVLLLGIEIPFISKLSINPEIELHFVKK